MHDPQTTLKQAQACADMMILMLEQTADRLKHDHPKDSEIHRVIRCSLRVGQTLHSARTLSEAFKYQDVWVLTRVLSEAAINASYLIFTSSIEKQRWSNYDHLMDLRFVEQMIEIGLTGDTLDIRAIEQLKRSRESLTSTQLYADTLRGSWSEKTLLQRAVFVDGCLKATMDVFTSLYKLAVKQGDSYVHSSPKAVGDQSVPIGSALHPQQKETQHSSQALAVACTGAYALLNCVRMHYRLEPHGLAERFGSDVKQVYAATANLGTS